MKSMKIKMRRMFLNVPHILIVNEVSGLVENKVRIRTWNQAWSHPWMAIFNQISDSVDRIDK